VPYFKGCSSGISGLITVAVGTTEEQHITCYEGKRGREGKDEAVSDLRI
jgi:hypothetical protein